jgi:hypothetical protein
MHANVMILHGHRVMMGGASSPNWQMLCLALRWPLGTVGSSSSSQQHHGCSMGYGATCKPYEEGM